jgi:ABC-type multidrug transport system permease subunit
VIEPEQRRGLPLKSVAGALLFSVFLGPVGLLYASSFGGTLFIVFGFIFVCMKMYVICLFIWLGSCIWSVIATNRYNKKVLL